ncbi:MAG TPA: hypothetical protein VLF59_05845 [Candidatus Saccharimonadales bacterium]|nr:hypothetical protein [Candidatus Saccharimonadales bacterium]
MLLSAVSKLLASLLASSLVGIVLVLTLTQTVLNSHYLEQKLQTTNSYQRLSVALSDQLSKGIKGVSPDQAKVVFAHILTPQVLQSKITGGLDQAQAYYQGDGPAPTIDLTDLATQAQAAGIPVPADSSIRKPITLGGSQKTDSHATPIATIWWTSVLSTLLCAAGLILVCRRRGKWTALPNVLIASGVLLGIMALLLEIGAHLVSDGAHFSSGSNAFSALGRDLGVLIAKDMAIRLGLWALAAGVFGIGMRVWMKRTTGTRPSTTPPQLSINTKQTPLIR